MKHIFFCLLFVFLQFTSFSQDNYEIQVYGSETVPKGNTMLELHSNFTFQAQNFSKSTMLSTNHALHETIEITHGWNSWFETGFYIFNSFGSDHRSNYVGSHIRPRVRAPLDWHLPVGLSLSLEAGYQKRAYSDDDWSVEIRPIIDKQMGKFYWALNPTFGKSLHGLNKAVGYVFSPNIKLGYNITKAIAGGVEYYGSVGPLNHIQPLDNQQRQIFVAIDIDWAKDWEFNCGYGVALTKSTDNSIFKMIVGYKFHHS